MSSVPKVDPELMRKIKGTIDSNKVVVYSKKDCEKCIETVKMFEKADTVVHTVMMDEEKDEDKKL